MANKKIFTDLEVDGRIDATRLNGTGLNDGFVPYKRTSLDALGDSKIFTNGVNTGFNTTTLTEMVNVNGDVLADGYKIPSGTSSQVLLADGTTGTMSTYTHPTHAGDDISIDTGALTGASVISDLDFNVTTDTNGHVTDANAAIATRNLTLGDIGFTGSSSANCEADGSVNQVAFFTDDTDITGDSGLMYDATNNNLTIGNIVTAVEYHNVVQVFNSNFAHASNNTWNNVPWNSIGDSANGGEQHFLLAPYSGRIRRVYFKNTGSGVLPTSTRIGFRLLKNGVLTYTSSILGMTPAYRMSKGFVLTDSNFVFAAGDDIRIQMISSNGLWQDTIVAMSVEWTY